MVEFLGKYTFKGYEIRGVEVTFARRDIRQATDAEIKVLDSLIEDEIRNCPPDRQVRSMVVESDWVEGNRVRYRLATEVTANMSALNPVDDVPYA